GSQEHAARPWGRRAGCRGAVRGPRGEPVRGGDELDAEAAPADSRRLRARLSHETPRCDRDQLRMPHERMREDPSQRSLACGDAVCGARQAVEESVIQLVERLLDAVMRAVVLA